MALYHLGKCCNHVNIQSDGPASVYQENYLGDYTKYGNTSNAYRSIMGSDSFLYKHSDGDWVVGINCQYGVLQYRVIIYLSSF